MARPARVSPTRILAAAAVEFAERGYAGARVDRIAKRARVNKAMLYYHFGSKQELYRALLRQTFSLVGRQLEEVVALDIPAEEQLDRAIAEFAAFVRDHAFFPAIMLREVAEGGVHLDRRTISELAKVPSTFGRIVQHGVAQARFRPVHPLAAYLASIAPIVMFLAGASIRRELAARQLAGASTLNPDALVRYVQEAAHRTLARPKS